MEAFDSTGTLPVIFPGQIILRKRFACPGIYYGKSWRYRIQLRELVCSCSSSSVYPETVQAAFSHFPSEKGKVLR